MAAIIVVTSSVRCFARSPNSSPSGVATISLQADALLTAATEFDDPTVLRLGTGLLSAVPGRSTPLGRVGLALALYADRLRAFDEPHAAASALAIAMQVADPGDRTEVDLLAAVMKVEAKAQEYNGALVDVGDGKDTTRHRLATAKSEIDQLLQALDEAGPAHHLMVRAIAERARSLGTIFDAAVMPLPKAVAKLDHAIEKAHGSTFALARLQMQEMAASWSSSGSDTIPVGRLRQAAANFGIYGNTAEARIILVDLLSYIKDRPDAQAIRAVVARLDELIKRLGDRLASAILQHEAAEALFKLKDYAAAFQRLLLATKLIVRFGAAEDIDAADYAATESSAYRNEAPALLRAAFLSAVLEAPYAITPEHSIYQRLLEELTEVLPRLVFRSNHMIQRSGPVVCG